MQKLLLTVTLGLLAIVAYIPPSHAYLDPGTTSMVLQAIIGAFVAGVVAMKIYWHKFKSLFVRREPGHQEETKTTSPDN